ncbi:hypothetical protein BDV12DRAFT_40340 [Aspergillus spectabilis]
MQTDFIVQNKWTTCTTPVSSRPQRNGPPKEPVEPFDAGHNDPESTYEVFRQTFSRSNLVVLSKSQTQKAPKSIPVPVTEETASLLRVYQGGIGPWNDILGHSLTYQRQVLRYTLLSPLIMHAVCALSAKQMSLISRIFLWEPVATRHYGRSLELLIESLTGYGRSREVIITATILLCSYELLSRSEADYQRHLYGARSLFQNHDVSGNGSDVELVSFWVYARQDVSMALVHESAHVNIAPGSKTSVLIL